MDTPLRPLIDFDRQVRAELSLADPDWTRQQVQIPTRLTPYLQAACAARVTRARVSATFPLLSMERVWNLAGMPDIPVGAILDGSQVLGTWTGLSNGRTVNGQWMPGSDGSDWDVSEAPIAPFAGRLDIHRINVGVYYRPHIMVVERATLSDGRVAHFGLWREATAPWPRGLAALGRWWDWFEGVADANVADPIWELVAALKCCDRHSGDATMHRLRRRWDLVQGLSGAEDMWAHAMARDDGYTSIEEMRRMNMPSRDPGPQTRG